jgi:hypothetical protein
MRTTTRNAVAATTVFFSTIFLPPSQSGYIILPDRLSFLSWAAASSCHKEQFHLLEKKPWRSPRTQMVVIPANTVGVSPVLALFDHETESAVSSHDFCAHQHEPAYTETYPYAGRIVGSADGMITCLTHPPSRRPLSVSLDMEVFSASRTP